MTDRLFTCSRCKEAKPFSEMSKRSGRPNGLHGWCKSCMNARARQRNHTPEQRKQWSYRTRYRLSTSDVEAMIANQGGTCAVCNEIMKRPVVDHDHATGQVRGILCHPCNVKLHALDGWPHRAAAARYLDTHK